MARKFDEYSDLQLFKMLNDTKQIAESAFTELFNRHSSKVYAYCRRFLGEREEALDVFQETFIKFHASAKIERKDDIQNIVGYLLAIARNQCMNLKRKEKPTTISYEDFMSSVDDEEQNEKEELLDLIHKALETLPDDYKEAFILREYQGLTYNEIAELTNVSVPNVKIRVHRAKLKIKEILQPYLNEL